MRWLSVLGLFGAIGIMGCTNIPSLEITSSAFTNKGNIPIKYSCEGEQASPPLTIADVPPSAKSLAIILYDPDAGYTHWVVWNIDPATKNITENFKEADQGLNSAEKQGYVGMCPPDGTHHYHFKVYALDTKLDLNKETGKEELERNMKGHILAQGEIVGLYKKASP